MGIGLVERKFECRRARGFLFITSETDGRFGEHIWRSEFQAGSHAPAANIDLWDFAVVQFALRLLSCCHRSAGETVPPKGFLMACTLLRVNCCKAPSYLPREGSFTPEPTLDDAVKAHGEEHGRK